jgi:hypothetical protein
MAHRQLQGEPLDRLRPQNEALWMVCMCVLLVKIVASNIHGNRGCKAVCCVERISLYELFRSGGPGSIPGTTRKKK